MINTINNTGVPTVESTAIYAFAKVRRDTPILLNNMPYANKEDIKKWYQKNKHNPEYIARIKKYEASDKRKQHNKNKGLRTALRLMQLSMEDYLHILESQKHSCAICKTPQSKLKMRLHIDHCHKTGNVRGLLCNNCNRGLGHFHDDINVMAQAIEYLNKPLNSNQMQ